jgi:hypothetical protein
MPAFEAKPKTIQIANVNRLLADATSASDLNLDGRLEGLFTELLHVMGFFPFRIVNRDRLR